SDPFCNGDKVAGRRSDVLDVHRDGYTVGPCTVCGDPERLVSQGKDCTAVGNPMGIFLLPAVHNDACVPVTRLRNLHSQKLRELALVKCRYPVSDGSGIVSGMGIRYHGAHRRNSFMIREAHLYFFCEYEYFWVSPPSATIYIHSYKDFTVPNFL